MTKVQKTEEITEKQSLIRFDDLKGSEVFNPDGEYLGKIEDFIYNIERNKIAFGVLSFGGVFGLGDTLFAIPWEKIQYKPKENTFITDVSKKQLDKAEGFYPDEYPDYMNHPWAMNIYRYWGYPPSAI